MAIERGTHVLALTATGTYVPKRALGAPTAGSDFTVVWLCSEDDYNNRTEERAIPWPAEDVTIAEQ